MAKIKYPINRGQLSTPYIIGYFGCKYKPTSATAQTVINACLNDMYSAGAGVVYFQEGNYTITSPINLPTGMTDLTIILDPKTNLIAENSKIFNFVGSARITIVGGYLNCLNQTTNNYGVYNIGNSITYIGVRGDFKGFGLFSTTSQAYYDYGTIRVQNCDLTGYGNNDIVGGGIATNIDGNGHQHNIDKILVTGSKIEQNLSAYANNGYEYAFDMTGVNKVNISNNTSIKGYVALGVEQQGNANVLISNNTSIMPATGSGADSTKIEVFINPTSTVNPTNFIIQNNTVQKGKIWIRNGSTKTVLNAKILNNYIDTTNTATDQVPYKVGVHLEYCSNSLVFANTIENANKGVWLTYSNEPSSFQVPFPTYTVDPSRITSATTIDHNSFVTGTIGIQDDSTTGSNIIGANNKFNGVNTKYNGSVKNNILDQSLMGSYADDSSAGTAGLTSGQLYKNTTSKTISYKS